MPVSDRRCVDCGRLYDVLVMGSRTISLTESYDGTGCPDCGSEQFVRSVKPAQPLPPKAASSLSFPYYDRGLGQTITSPSHRKSVMKKLGVVEVGGGWGNESKVSSRTAEIEATRKKHAEDLDRYENDPAFRPWREAREQLTDEAVADAKVAANAAVDKAVKAAELELEAALSAGADPATTTATVELP